MQVSAENNHVPRQPTITDVARAAGVSRAAASRVLNDVAGVSPEVRQRVRSVMDQIGYRPNPAARALASGRSGVLDLVVVDDCPITFGVNPYFGRVIAGVLTALAGGNGHLRVHMVPERDAPALLERVSRGTDLGAVLVNVPTALAARAYLACQRIVALNGSGPRVPVVDTENTAGAYSAVRHLQQAGRRRIAGLHGPAEVPCAMDRRRGYVEAMRDAAMAPIHGGGEFSREIGVAETRRLLDSHPDLDALFVACDLTATGALQALAAVGRRVPDDVAVVGYDDSLIAACAIPALTSVRQPVEEMAEAATRALLDHRVAPYWRMVFPAELVVRHSS
jgi:DNA-binding LacI/PurR family transcriptional regulator